MLKSLKNLTFGIPVLILALLVAGERYLSHWTTTTSFKIEKSSAATENQSYDSLQWSPLSPSNYSEIITEPHKVWLRATVNNTDPIPRVYWFGIDYPFVEPLYVTSNSVQLRTPTYQTNGKKFFKIIVPAKESLDLALLVNTYRGLVKWNVVLTPESQFHAEITSDTWLNLIVGIILGLLVYNIILAFIEREKSFVYYALYVASLMSSIACYAGIIFQDQLGIPRQILYTIPWSFGYLALLFAALYFSEVIALSLNFKNLDRLLKFLVFPISFAVTLGLLIPVDWHAYLFPSMATFILCFAFYCLERIRHSRKLIFFIYGWLGLVTFNLLFSLSNLNIIDTGPHSEYLLLVSLTWESIFFSAGIAAQKQRHKNLRSLIARIEKGMTPMTELQNYIDSPLQDSLIVQKQSVTIMFLDIVGYSLTSSVLGDKKTFQVLRSRMARIEKIITNYQGAVNKNLGDGIICFFGYGKDGSDHAAQALKAAIEIQAISTKPENLGNQKIILPTRIGINTDKVIIGNVGTIERPDYTLIGDGVNFASRLESCCNSFRILISQSTLEASKLSDIEGQFNEAYISIKHHKEAMVAYEYAGGNSQDRIYAEQQYFQQVQKKITSERFHVLDNSLNIHLEKGVFKIYDLSDHGMGVVGDFFLGVNHKFTGKIVSTDPELNELFEQSLLSELKFTVKWSRKSAGLYKHGLEVHFTNQAQSQRFKDIIHPYLVSSSEIAS